jgi:hypothetical protein
MSTVQHINATGSFSRNAHNQIVVEARSRHFVARALHPMARVGRVPVVGLVCSKGVLTGLLLGTPREGDELFVRYLPEPELRTRVRFALEPPAVA